MSRPEQQRPSKPSSVIPDGVEFASFDPLPPDTDMVPRRWWGRHPQEWRSALELAQLLVDPVYRGEGVPRGDGSPVMLVPGFLAGDASLAVMRQWLGRMGYDPHPAGIALNVDCSNRVLDRLDYRLWRIHADRGRKVALVGHSRGGHLVKALAHRYPERISSVISMGAGLTTPFDISIPTKLAVAAVRTVHQRGNSKARAAGCFTDTCRCRFARDYGAEFPPEIPLTSVYTRGDGVVWWEACVVPYARNVEVSSSHVGLAFNRESYLAVAEALADASPAREGSRDERAVASSRMSSRAASDERRSPMPRGRLPESRSTA